jgi:glycosyltransferase involved in cell wall biosynthesis
MRVLYVLDSLADGGAETSLAHIAAAYRDADIDLHVAFLRSRWDVAATLRQSGATLHPVALDGGRWTQLRSLVRLIREQSPDVVHTTLYEADVLGRLAATAARRPVVTTLANSAYSADHYSDPSVRRFKLGLAQGVDAATATLADRFHAVSPTVAADMSRRLLIPPSRITVIPRSRSRESLGWPSDHRRLKVRAALGLSDDRPLVLAAARQEHQKGLDVLIAAAPALAGWVPDTLILIAGREGRATSQLRAAVAAADVTDGVVRFLGARDDVPDLIVASDVVVVPSRFEGMPGLVLEAMALDTPVVASEIPMVRDAIGDHAHALVPVGDSDALADALARTLRRPNLDTIGLARERFESSFTPEAVVAAMRRFYEAAISGT